MSWFIGVAIIIIGLLITYIYRFSIRKLGVAYSIAARAAIDEFNSFSSPARFSSTEEVENYFTRYYQLYSEIAEYKSKRFVSEELFSELKLDDFKKFFENIRNLHKENNDLNQSIGDIDQWLCTVEAAFDKFNDVNHYFTFSEKEDFLKRNRCNIDLLLKLYPDYNNLFSYKGIGAIYSWLKDIESSRLSHNRSFVESELENNSFFFDNVLSYPLDIEQRLAIVKLEDNVLVISSAGSGKTSTIIGKARYLLDKRRIAPSKLLILTYTRKAAKELVERLNDKDVDCTTFHSLAYRILAELENRKPSICEKGLLLNVFKHLLQTDTKFVESVLHYILHMQSLMKLEHDYDDAPSYFADRKKYGIQAIYTDFKGNIIFTRSEEEKRICTYLTELGVNFLYEEPYQYPTYTRSKRQYKPDFTIYYDEEIIEPHTGVISYQHHIVYLEHFAIDAQGNVPKWFGDKDPKGRWYQQNKIYKEGIVWKRQQHRDRHTVLIETTSADFHSGRILEVLKEQLIKVGVPIRIVPPEELYNRLVHRNKMIENSVFTLLEQFIALLKSNCGSIQPLIEKAKQSKDERTEVILSTVIKPLFYAYSAELERRGEIDFIDAIIQATKYCCAGQWRKYDYILVDEFQDISVDRYHFLQFLRANDPQTKLFCVGDDWQSIYRFAGSDMKLFYKFEEYFGFTEHCKIEKTYRFFNPIIDISSDFIQKNPEQQKKSIISNAAPMPAIPAVKCATDETVNISIDGRDYCFRKSDIPKVTEWNEKYHTTIHFHDCGKSDEKKDKTLQEVISIIESIPPKQTILILGRYSYDVNSIGYNTDKQDFNRSSEKIVLNIAGRKIPFMTVHSAKGLEADHVILVKCNEGIYGFPSLVEDDPILEYVLSEDDHFENAEERRVFYVCLTRARRKIHILYNGDKPSPFVRELTNVLKDDSYICPLCQQGHIVIIKNGIAKTGEKYTNYGCSNGNSGCEYFERVFGDNVPRFMTFNEQMKQRQ